MAESTMEEVVNVEGDLESCGICGRTFLPASLEKHTRVCERNATRKRKVFDSLKQRVEGTELAPFHQRTYLKKSNPPIISSPHVNKNSSKWREKHLELVNTIRAARGLPAEMPGSPKRSFSNTTSTSGRCPSCDRQFGPRAYDRHVEWCKEHKARIHKSPAEVLLAKERLDARIKYRVPPPIKSKRTLIREKYSPTTGNRIIENVVSVKSTSCSNLERAPSIRKPKSVNNFKKTHEIKVEHHIDVPMDIHDKHERNDVKQRNVPKEIKIPILDAMKSPNSTRLKLPKQKVNTIKINDTLEITVSPLTGNKSSKKMVTWRDTIPNPKLNTISSSNKNIPVAVNTVNHKNSIRDDCDLTEIIASNTSSISNISAKDAVVKKQKQRALAKFNTDNIKQKVTNKNIELITLNYENKSDVSLNKKFDTNSNRVNKTQWIIPELESITINSARKFNTNQSCINDPGKLGLVSDNESTDIKTNTKFQHRPIKLDKNRNIDVQGACKENISKSLSTVGFNNELETFQIDEKLKDDCKTDLSYETEIIASSDINKSVFNVSENSGLACKRDLDNCNSLKKNSEFEEFQTESLSVNVRDEEIKMYDRNQLKVSDLLNSVQKTCSKEKYENEHHENGSSNSEIDSNTGKSENHYINCILDKVLEDHITKNEIFLQALEDHSTDESSKPQESSAQSEINATESISQGALDFVEKNFKEDLSNLDNFSVSTSSDDSDYGQLNSSDFNKYFESSVDELCELDKPEAGICNEEPSESPAQLEHLLSTTNTIESKCSENDFQSLKSEHKNNSQTCNVESRCSHVSESSKDAKNNEIEQIEQNSTSVECVTTSNSCLEKLNGHKFNSSTVKIQDNPNAIDSELSINEKFTKSTTTSILTLYDSHNLPSDLESLDCEAADTWNETLSLARLTQITRNCISASCFEPLKNSKVNYRSRSENNASRYRKLKLESEKISKSRDKILEMAEEQFLGQIKQQLNDAPDTSSSSDVTSEIPEKRRKLYDASEESLVIANTTSDNCVGPRNVFDDSLKQNLEKIKLEKEKINQNEEKVSSAGTALPAVTIQRNGLNYIEDISPRLLDIINSLTNEEVDSSETVAVSKKHCWKLLTLNPDVLNIFHECKLPPVNPYLKIPSFGHKIDLNNNQKTCVLPPINLFTKSKIPVLKKSQCFPEESDSRCIFPEINHGTSDKQQSDYSPFETAERQLMELLECDDFKPFFGNTKQSQTTRPHTTNNAKSYQNNKNKNIYSANNTRNNSGNKLNPISKRSSVIDPPSDFQDKLNNLNDDFELIESLINQNYADGYDENDFDSVSSKISKNLFPDTNTNDFSGKQRKYSDDMSSIDPRLINENDNLSIPENFKTDNYSSNSSIDNVTPLISTLHKENYKPKRNEKTGKSVPVLNKRATNKQTNETKRVLKNTTKLIAKDIHKSSAPLNSSFGSTRNNLNADKAKSLTSLKRSVSLMDSVKPKNLKNKQDVQNYFNEQDRKNTTKTERTSPDRQTENNKKNEIDHVFPTAEELFPVDDELYEEYKQFEETYLRDKQIKMQNDKKPKEDFGSSGTLTPSEGSNNVPVNKVSADSAYSSLNRKTPKVRARSTKLAPLERQESNFSPVGSPTSSGSETSPSFFKRGSPSQRLSKFCHECGNKYPINTAKFCVECGIKRLVL